MTAYAFANKVLRCSKWVWYFGICAALFQAVSAVLVLLAGMDAQESLRSTQLKYGLQVSNSSGLNFSSVVACVVGVAATLAWFYIGSLALMALGENLKVGVESAMNTSLALADSQKTAVDEFVAKQNGKQENPDPRFNKSC